MLTIRRVLQALFLMLTIVGVFIIKGNAERWCPFGGVEALYVYLKEGNMICSLGISNFYILAAVILMTLLLRRAFCGYLCPIGTISEWIHRLAKLLKIKTVSIPPKFDRSLALIKYPLLVFILYITWKAGELLFRQFDPCYALISRHGEDITFGAYVVAATIIIASIFKRNRTTTKHC